MTNLYYLASPYTHKSKKVMSRRFKQVCKIAGILQKQGKHVLCPIASSHPIAKYGRIQSTKWKYWARLDINFLSRCDGMIISMLDKDWYKSVGMKAEFLYAKKNNIPVILVTKDGHIVDIGYKKILKMFNFKLPGPCHKRGKS